MVVQERRKEPRFPLFAAGRIGFGGRKFRVTCLVQNVSSSGAKLVLRPRTDLPFEFHLRICEEMIEDEMRMRCQGASLQSRKRIPGASALAKAGRAWRGIQGLRQLPGAPAANQLTIACFSPQGADSSHLGHAQAGLFCQWPRVCSTRSSAEKDGPGPNDRGRPRQNGCVNIGGTGARHLATRASVHPTVALVGCIRPFDPSIGFNLKRGKPNPAGRCWLTHDPGSAIRLASRRTADA